MRFTPIVATLALSTLAACATRPDAPAPVVEASAPAPIDGYDWFMHADEQEAMLAYGVANSDDLKLRLDCAPASGRLRLTTPAAGSDREIFLESGGDAERYAAVAEPSGIHDGDLLIAEAAAADPVFLRFRRLGWIAAWHGDQREVYAAHPGSQKGVSDFFAACG